MSDAMKRIFVAAICSTLLLLHAVRPVHGWSGHDTITAEALEGIEWLDRYYIIPVTTPSPADDPSLNPKFENLYANPFPPDSFPPEGEFFDFFIPCGPFYRFEGKKIGGYTTAREILVQYSSEPDWKMDTDLPGNLVSRFMGGSQGYRHMYYPAWSLKFPNLLLPQGKAPERAQYFFDLGVKSLKSGDMYWAFRFFARALHYIEDLGQPFHAIQTIPRLIVPEKLMKGTTQTTRNYHYAFEGYVANRISGELGGRFEKDYLKMLRSGRLIEERDVRSLAIKIAKLSNRNAAATISSSIDFLGSSFYTEEKIFLSLKKFEELVHRNSRTGESFDRQVRMALNLTATGIRSFMEIVRVEIEKETTRGGR